MNPFLRFLICRIVIPRLRKMAKVSQNPIDDEFVEELERIFCGKRP
jgi:hypothetical protein